MKSHGVETPGRPKPRPARVPIRALLPQTRVATFAEVLQGYSPAEAVTEARRCVLCAQPECVRACPFGEAIPEAAEAIQRGDFAAALALILRDNPFPGVCGRICSAPCEAACLIPSKRGAVAIRHLERAAASQSRVTAGGGSAAEAGPRGGAGGGSGAERPATRDRKVVRRVAMAVIGGGPAGLACAWRLSQMGHAVTLFEATRKLGGTLHTAVPAFRLPSPVVDADIKRIVALGIDIRLENALGKQLTLDTLLEPRIGLGSYLGRGFAAVFLAIGASRPRPLGFEGEPLHGVWHAVEFLERVCSSRPPDLGGRQVAVVGGGTEAIDAARSAKRLGADTVLLYQRELGPLAGAPVEVRQALEEGVAFQCLAQPVSLLGDARRRLRSIVCRRLRLGELDASGRFHPVPIAGSEFVLDADVLVKALGQGADPAALALDGIAWSRANLVEVIGDGEAKGAATSMRGVYAGGGCVTGSLDPLRAMADGIGAATAMDSYVRATLRWGSLARLAEGNEQEDR